MATCQVAASPPVQPQPARNESVIEPVFFVRHTFNFPSRRSIMGHAVHSGSAAAHSRPGPPRAHRRVQVGAPHRRNHIYNALFNACNSRRGFMDDGHLTFVTDVRSSKVCISRICFSTTVLFYVAPNAGAGGRAAEEQRC